MPARAVSWVLDHRYGILSAVLFVWMGLKSLGGRWLRDFWMHASCIREFSIRLTDPRHPVVPVDAPFYLMGPYSAFWGAVSRATGWDAVATLGLAGMVNLVILLTGFDRAVRALTRSPDRVASFYALMLAVFSWGSLLWMYSGFLHIRALLYVFPYPSTFACGLTLHALALNRSRLDTGRDGWLAAIGALALVILLSHPLTFVFLVAGMAAMWPQPPYGPRKVLTHLIRTGGTLALAVFAGLTWPHFPLMNLVVGTGGGVGWGSMAMYQGGIMNFWPLLAGVLLVGEAIRSRERRTLAAMLTMLVLLYVYSFLSGRHIWGRVIASVMLLVAILLGDYLARLERRLSRDTRPFPLTWRRLAVPVTVVCVCLAISAGPIRKSTFLLYGALHPHRNATYRAIAGRTGPDGVVLAELEWGLPITAYGGKTVACWFHTDSADDDWRQRDVKRFFDSETTGEARRFILARYRPDFVALSDPPGPEREEWMDRLEGFCEVDMETDGVVLLRPRTAAP